MGNNRISTGNIIAFIYVAGSSAVCALALAIWWIWCIYLDHIKEFDRLSELQDAIADLSVVGWLVGIATIAASGVNVIIEVIMMRRFRQNMIINQTAYKGSFDRKTYTISNVELLCSILLAAGAMVMLVWNIMLCAITMA